MDFYRARYPLACWSSIALVIQSLDCALQMYYSNTLFFLSIMTRDTVTRAI